MAKRKQNRRQQRLLEQQRRLDKLITIKTALFSRRKESQRRELERSSRLVSLLYINGMLR